MTGGRFRGLPLFCAFAAVCAAASVRAATTNVSGVVTFAREGVPFYFVQDSSGANWRVSRPVDAPAAEVGDRIEASGEREPSAKHRLAARKLAVAGRDPAGAPPPRKISVGELFKNIMPFGNTRWYGGMFTVEGLLRDINRRQNSTQILVGEGDLNVMVELPVALEAPLPAKLMLGATVEATGALAYTSIENYEEGVFGRIENVELMPCSLDAVRVVKRAPAPPFWTVRRLWSAFGTLAAVLAASFFWNAALRRAVRRKTRELADSIRQRETVRIEADVSRRERLRLAADLHDGFQQYLAGAMFRLKAAINYLPKTEAKCREQLEKAREALQHTQNGLRQTLWAMNEESEGPESLVALLRFVARRMAHWEGVVDIECEGEERPVARNFCGSLLLIMQEAVGNALRHGEAAHVKVGISFGDGTVSMSVEDDGKGFEPPAEGSPAGHYGLATMKRRIGELGGAMSIDSAPGKGARVRFTFPG